MNHYPRHVGDFIRDTVGLSLAERGAYTALLDQYYASEKPIAYAERYRMTGAVSKADKAAVDYVMGRYFTESTDGWHQKRADVEIAAYHDRCESAKRSINARWSKRNTNVSETNEERTTNQRPVTSNHKPVGQEQSGANAPAPAKRPRGSRLPPGWELPASWGDWARQERPEWGSTDVLRVSLLFRDHWQGKGEARADWEATWRNWVRRERSQKNGRADARAVIAAGHFQGVKSDSNIHDISGESERVA